MTHEFQSSVGFGVVSRHDLDVGHTGTTGASTSTLDVSDPAEPRLEEAGAA